MRPGQFGAVLAITGAVAVCVGGCGPRSSNPGPDDLVCRNEAPIGSRIVERRCYRRREIEARRIKDRAFMERLIIEANRPRRNPAGGRPNPR
jgi:hypothetical protein